jgi:hypothetical protein
MPAKPLVFQVEQQRRALIQWKLRCNSSQSRCRKTSSRRATRDPVPATRIERRVFIIGQ